MKEWKYLPRGFLVSVIALVALAATLSAQTASWRSTTNTNRWVDNGTLFSTGWTGTPNYLEIFPDSLCQTIEGFGGSFSEKAWDAIAKVSPARQDSVIRALFDTAGCCFNNCRLPIGANDFAVNLSYYSLDDFAGDYSMSHFNLSRDSLRIVPFVKAALACQPGLVVWGSPWTPPSWMRTDGKYYGGSGIKQDSQTLNAYALYLAKTVKAFKEKGITITALSPQNEPTQGNGYAFPTCVWTPAQFSGFFVKYLIPMFKKECLDTRLMWGTFCCGTYADWIQTPLCDTALLNNISIIGLQHTESSWQPQICASYPGKKIYETETDCCHGSGTNDWSDGVTQFNLLATFLNGGSVQYSEWNMVLDKSGLSGWNWKQNAMITIDTAAKTVTYNPSYYGVRHWSQYIKKNARRIKLSDSSCTLGGKTSAYLNPDGSIVVLAGNETADPYPLSIKLGNRAICATLPAQSLNTFVIRPEVSTFKTHSGSASAPLMDVVRFRNSTLSFAVNPNARIDGIDLAIRDLKGKTIWFGHKSGAELRGSSLQAIAIKTKTGALPSGCYLLEATIRSEGSVTKTAEKISAVY